MKSPLLILFLKYGLGLGLLAWVMGTYWHIPSPDGTEELGLARVLQQPLHWPFLALAAAIGVASVLLTFVRWFVLVRAQGLPFSLPSALRLGMIGFYLSTFLPGSVGGDIIKAVFIAREQSRRTVAITTVIMDRVIGLCGLVWLVTLVGWCFWVAGILPARAALQTIFLGAVGLSAGSFVFWFLLGALSQDRADRLTTWLRGIPKLGGPLGELWRAGWAYRCQGRSVGAALGLSMIGHVGFVLMFYFCARAVNAVNEMPTLAAHVFAVPVGMAIAAGIPTPGGVGGGEFVYGELYKMLGYAVAAGVLASLMQRCINWALGLVGYLIYLRMKPDLVNVAPREAAGGVASRDFRVRATPQAAETHASKLT
jgi:glycosyltransferase 2 family protein